MYLQGSSIKGLVNGKWWRVTHSYKVLTVVCEKDKKNDCWQSGIYLKEMSPSLAYFNRILNRFTLRRAYQVLAANSKCVNLLN